MTSFSSSSDGSSHDSNSRVELTSIEARIVGCLIEKAFLTPDIYPMTTNSIVTACNQKTNRDPIVDFDARTVDATLLVLRQRNIVRRVHTKGARSTKHRHALDELLDLAPEQLALVSVLLLRGDQTVGELRLRTERHLRIDDQEGFETLEQVEECLGELAARPQPLVMLLAREPGKKEARWRHLIGTDDDGPVVPAPAEQPVAAAPAPRPEPRPPVEHQPSAAAPALASGVGTPASGNDASRIDALEQEVAALRRQIRQLADALGESLE